MSGLCLYLLMIGHQRIITVSVDLSVTIWLIGDWEIQVDADIYKSELILRQQHVMLILMRQLVILNVFVVTIVGFHRQMRQC